MRTPSTRRDDSGFSLVEVVVAAVVLSLMGAAVAGVLLQAVAVTGDNARRVQAASIARDQIELVRSGNADDIPDGTVQVGSRTVQGTTYTITQNAALLGAGSAASACRQTGADLAYKRVTVSVGWPDMGSTKPVRADTLVALTAVQRAAGSSLGAVAFAVDLYDGSTTARLSGANVTVGTQTQTTGDDGCVVFDSLTPGTYATAVTAAGYSDPDGRTTTTGTVTATAGSITRPAPVVLGQTGRLRVTVTAPAGYTSPTPLATIPLTLDTALFAPTTFRTFADCSGVATAPVGCVSGTPRTAAPLFPATYTVSAGDCSVIPPAGTAPSVQVPASGTVDATVPLGGVNVRLTSLLDILTSSTVTVTSQGRNGCSPTSVTVDGVTRQGKNVALPSGTYTFSRPALLGLLSVTRQVTVDATKTPGSVEL